MNSKKSHLNARKSKQKLRLVFFSYGILEQGGGFENYLIQTARDLANLYHGLDIKIITMSPKRVERLQHFYSVYFMKKQDPKAIYREDYDAIIKKLGPVTYARVDSNEELAKQLRDSDVIYSKNEILELITLKTIGFKKLPPIILGAHTPIFYPHTPSLSSKLHNFLYGSILYRSLIKNATSIQVNNESDLVLFRDRLGFSNTKIIRQGFPIKPLDIKHTGQNTDRLNILFIGRLTEAKGIDILVDTINMLEDKGVQFSLKIAGSGDDANVVQINNLASNSKNVTYLGHVPNQNISDLYDWCDVTLITSKYETLSKVAIETALAGKIAVCTDLPGPREIIKNNETGYLLPLSVESFVKILNMLSKMKRNNPGDLETMGREAYAYISERFNPGNAYRELHLDITNVALRRTF